MSNLIEDLIYNWEVQKHRQFGAAQMLLSLFFKTELKNEIQYNSGIKIKLSWIQMLFGWFQIWTGSTLGHIWDSFLNSFMDSDCSGGSYGFTGSNHTTAVSSCVWPASLLTSPLLYFNGSLTERWLMKALLLSLICNKFQHKTKD